MILTRNGKLLKFIEENNMTVIIIDNGITEAYTNDLRDFKADIITAFKAKEEKTAALYEISKAKLNGVIKQIEGKRK